MTTPETPQENVQEQEFKDYLAIRTEFLRPWGSGRFSVYIRKGQGLILYAARGGAYTKDQAQKLRAMGLSQVYLHKGEYRHYENYLRENLGDILLDDSIPLAERGELWHGPVNAFEPLAGCLVCHQIAGKLGQGRGNVVTLQFGLGPAEQIGLQSGHAQAHEKGLETQGMALARTGRPAEQDLVGPAGVQQPLPGLGPVVDVHPERA